MWYAARVRVGVGVGVRVRVRVRVYSLVTIVLPVLISWILSLGSSSLQSGGQRVGSD